MEVVGRGAGEGPLASSIGGSLLATPGRGRGGGGGGGGAPLLAGVEGIKGLDTPGRGGGDGGGGGDGTAGGLGSISVASSEAES